MNLGFQQNRIRDIDPKNDRRLKQKMILQNLIL